MLGHWPGYFFARSLGAGKFPIIVFVPGKVKIRTKEKGRRSVRISGLLCAGIILAVRLLFRYLF